MVHAKIHIICGNCGNTDFVFNKNEGYLGCKDCATIHDLKDKYKQKGCIKDENI